jgi:hypothetical protein
VKCGGHLPGSHLLWDACASGWCCSFWQTAHHLSTQLGRGRDQPFAGPEAWCSWHVLACASALASSALPFPVLNLPCHTHPTGHGGYEDDPTGLETDGQNETLCPVDHMKSGQIVDDELNRTLINPLPKVRRRAPAWWHAQVQAGVLFGRNGGLVWPGTFPERLAAAAELAVADWVCDTPDPLHCNLALLLHLPGPLPAYRALSCTVLSTPATLAASWICPIRQQGSRGGTPSGSMPSPAQCPAR